MSSCTECTKYKGKVGMCWSNKNQSCVGSKFCKEISYDGKKVSYILKCTRNINNLKDLSELRKIITSISCKTTYIYNSGADPEGCRRYTLATKMLHIYGQRWKCQIDF